MTTKTKHKKTAFEYADEAERETSVCVLRSAKQERDWGIGWLATARQYQDDLNEALEALDQAQHDNRLLFARLEAALKEVARHDTSFQPPKPEVV